MKRTVSATRTAALATVITLGALAGCGSADRPTLTTERLDESATAPVEQGDTSPTATIDGDNTTADDPSRGSGDAASSTTASGDAAAGDDAARDSEGATDDAADTASATDPTADQQPPEGVVERLTVQVLERLPHDPNAFTQGLELHDGTFIESTGALYSPSDLRRVDPVSGQVTQSVPTPNNFFAEGVTRVGDQLVQLTYQDNTAIYWDLNSFEQLKQVTYEGEGWGLCFDGARLVMTNGSSSLIFRDPVSFDEIGRVDVSLDGQPLVNLNEVECVDGVVWANVWFTDLIVRIDPTSGIVTGVVDATSLERPAERTNDVLNGIAWDASTQSFYVTGKMWPTMYRVAFVAASDT